MSIEFDPAFEVAKSSPAVLAVLGDPPRFFGFGEAKQDGAKPYAVHQTINGSPENYLKKLPDQDTWVVQVDGYAQTPQLCKDVIRALVASFEPVAYITSWNGNFRDPDTKLWRISFTVEFKTDR